MSPGLIALLKQTPLVDRNRLLADVSSFLAFCGRQVPEALAVACKQVGVCGLRDLFSSFSLAAALAWENEHSARTKSELSAQWRLWLESIESNSVEPANPVDLPLHVAFLLHAQWDEENFLKATQIFLVARQVYQILTARS